jgi:hypothetical protein
MKAIKKRDELIQSNLERIKEYISFNTKDYLFSDETMKKEVDALSACLPLENNSENNYSNLPTLIGLFKSEGGTLTFNSKGVYVNGTLIIKGIDFK